MDEESDYITQQRHIENVQKATKIELTKVEREYLESLYKWEEESKNSPVILKNVN